MLKYFCTLFFLTTSFLCFSQSDETVLLYINDEAITVEEFKSVYQKNISLVKDDTQKDPRQYLELFKEYKLKVQEAYKQGLHKKPTYIRELKGYRKQLVKNYLTDVEVTESLIKEAYDRTVTEVNARHILVRIGAEATPEDTLKAYSKILQARDLIVKGEDFKTVAKRYSDDPSAQKNGGDLGWFKAFKMVYPFETAAFSIDTGEVSLPFRTQFGYHIVQTTAKREYQGAIEVAHIMISLKQKDSTLDPEKRIQDIYTLIENGGDFENLAKIHSDDKRSSVKGGVLGRFESGQLSSPIFEEKVFLLQNIGDYTEPFKTKFGWHIAKLIEKFPVKSYEQERDAIEAKLKRDERSKIISDTLITKLRSYYGIKDAIEVVPHFVQLLPDNDAKKGWRYGDSTKDADKVVFTLNDTVLRYIDFGKYITNTLQRQSYSSKKNFVEQALNAWTSRTIRRYHENHLEEHNPEFKAVLREYKEGLLLFDLLESKVWGIAKNDTIRLQKYYQDHIETYRKPEQLEVTIITGSKKSTLTKIKKLLRKGVDIESIEGIINKDQEVNALFSNKEITKADTNYIVKEYTPTLGLSDIYKNDNEYVLYNVIKILPSRLRTLDEIKGTVINDFQKEIEQDWLEELKISSKITVDEKVLKTLIKEVGE